MSAGIFLLAAAAVSSLRRLPARRGVAPAILAALFLVLALFDLLAPVAAAFAGVLVILLPLAAAPDRDEVLLAESLFGLGADRSEIRSEILLRRARAFLPWWLALLPAAAVAEALWTSGWTTTATLAGPAAALLVIAALHGVLFASAVGESAVSERAGSQDPGAFFQPPEPRPAPPVEVHLARPESGTEGGFSKLEEN